MSILPEYDVTTDTYFGNTQYGRESITDIQECVYVGSTQVTDRIRSIYDSKTNESDGIEDTLTRTSSLQSMLKGGSPIHVRRKRGTIDMTPLLNEGERHNYVFASLASPCLIVVWWIDSNRTREKLPSYICVYEDTVVECYSRGSL